MSTSGWRWFRWAWVLPLGELILVLAVAGIPVTKLLMYERREAALTKNAVKDRPAVTFPITSGKILIFREEVNPWFSYRYEALSFLNFPGLFGGLLMDRLFPAWPQEWIPTWAEPLGMWGWRALSWPVFSVPFWWLAGRGLDSFIASLTRIDGSRSIRWFEGWGFAAIGALILVLCSGLSFMSDSELKSDSPEIHWLFLPGIMWFVFGLISLLAWWRQRRGRRALLAEILSTSE